MEVDDEDDEEVAIDDDDDEDVFGSTETPLKTHNSSSGGATMSIRGSTAVSGKATVLKGLDHPSAF